MNLIIGQSHRVCKQYLFYIFNTLRLQTSSEVHIRSQPQGQILINYTIMPAMDGLNFLNVCVVGGGSGCLKFTI